jgi:hypothetical protein
MNTNIGGSKIGLRRWKLRIVADLPKWSTAPTGALASRESLVTRLLDAWRGTEGPAEDSIEPGSHSFRPENGFSQRSAELYHDTALKLGFESEIVYFQRRKPRRAWRVTVRRPGEREPPFMLGDDDAPLAE